MIQGDFLSCRSLIFTSFFTIALSLWLCLSLHDGVLCVVNRIVFVGAAIVFVAISQNLLGEGVHATCRFSRADRAHDGDTSEKASFRDDQPARCSEGICLRG
jgi:hypothetical protein